MLTVSILIFFILFIGSYLIEFMFFMIGLKLARDGKIKDERLKGVVIDNSFAKLFGETIAENMIKKTPRKFFVSFVIAALVYLIFK